MTEPQESAWNSSDVFPSDDALILHFVLKYPDVEDLDETIQDDILGEEFESVKEMASKKIEKVAKRLGLSADLLREIIDAKQKMIEKEQEKISGKNKK